MIRNPEKRWRFEVDLEIKKDFEGVNWLDTGVNALYEGEYTDTHMRA